MTEPERAANLRAGLDKGKNAELAVGRAPAEPSPEGGAAASSAAESATPPKLTAEEQMALYEKELKDNDWGHQPC